MYIWMKKNKTYLISQLSNPLLKNSLYIILTSISTAGFGFVFWMIAAKMYSTENVGVATALISSMTLIILLSKIGIDTSIIRFIPEGDKNKIFSTSIIVTTFVSILLGVIFILAVDIFSPELKFLKDPYNAIIYLLILIANSLTTIATVCFISIRRAELQFYQSFIIGSRILFLFPFVFAGSYGIFGSFGLSFILGLIFTFFLFSHSGIKLGYIIDKSFLKNSLKYSAENYIINLFFTVPNQILPLVCISLLGDKVTAYYYISYAISSLLLMIPSSITTSLFVECSNGINLKKTVIQSLITMYLLLIPSIIILYFKSSSLLLVIGKDYSENGTYLLQIMSFTSLFVPITLTYLSIKRVQKDMSTVIALSGSICMMLIGFGYFFTLKFGLDGLGYAWIGSYGIGSVLVGILMLKKYI